MTVINSVPGSPDEDSLDEDWLLGLIDRVMGKAGENMGCTIRRVVPPVSPEEVKK